VPRSFGDYTDGQTVFGIETGKTVLYVKIAPLKVGLQTAEHHVELLFGERLVHFSPPDPVFRIRLFDDEFVFGRSAGVKSGSDHNSSQMSQKPFSVPNDMFVERWCVMIPVYITHICNAMIVQSKLAE